VDYLKAFLTMLDGMDGEGICAVVTDLEFFAGEKNRVLAQVRFPGGYKVDEADPLEKRLETAAKDRRYKR
jgi:hypothetical protein